MLNHFRSVSLSARLIYKVIPLMEVQGSKLPCGLSLIFLVRNNKTIEEYEYDKAQISLNI